jgi:hypothetical protein
VIVKQKLIGIWLILSLISPLGCLSSGDVAEVVQGESVEADASAAADLLTGVLGDGTNDELSKGDLLATLIELFAASSGASGSEELLWDVAASAARDGRAGVKRSVADFVINEATEAVVGAIIPDTP